MHGPSAVWLNGVRGRSGPRAADIRAGTTIDQFAARALGEETPLRSLELALEPNFLVGNCEGGYSCVYVNTFSWRTPTMPLPMETNPHAVFERLFGQGGDPEARLAQMRKDRSLLDAVTEDMRRLQRALGPAATAPPWTAIWTRSATWSGGCRTRCSAPTPRRRRP